MLQALLGEGRAQEEEGEGKVKTWEHQPCFRNAGYSPQVLPRRIHADNTKHYLLFLQHMRTYSIY